jgi:hypothetical protein
MIKIDGIKLLQESEKAWYIQKIIPGDTSPSKRWIPKSLSNLSDCKNVIYVVDWFYNVWMNEKKLYREKWQNIQLARQNETENRNLLEKSSYYTLSTLFINNKIEDQSITKRYSNSEVVFYLGEFLLFSIDKNLNLTRLHYNHRLKDLLTKKHYNTAYNFIKSRILHIQSPNKDDLLYLLTEFMVECKSKGIC